MATRLAIIVLLLTCCNNNIIVSGFIGIYWGRFATQSLVPSVVVDLIKQNGISDVRLAAPSPNVLESMEGSYIGFNVGLPNDFVRRNKWSNLKDIDTWVEELLVLPINRGVNITTLVVLQQPLSRLGGRIPIWNFTDVYRETRRSLKDHGLGHIKLTTSHMTDMLNNASKPSKADFDIRIKVSMVESIKLLHETKDAFFTLEMYPLYSVLQYDWPIEFAFMDNNSNFTIKDGEYTYTNVFDFIYDSMVVAIEKAGYPDMEIMVGMIGWPTDGGKYATPENAERFYNGFLMHIGQNKGTPRRPNRKIDVFLAELLDENKIGPTVGNSQRHLGIYDFEGKPKYKIDFSGQGRDIYPAIGKGTVKMPSRWCIFNGDMSNKTMVEKFVEYACNLVDCTPLSSDSTCSNLNYTWNVSYAFNSYYQTMNQRMEIGACYFGGLGALTPFDPSVNTCIFPVEILTAEAVDGGIQIFNYVGYSTSNADTYKCYVTTQLLLILISLFISTVNLFLYL